MKRLLIVLALFVTISCDKLSSGYNPTGPTLIPTVQYGNPSGIPARINGVEWTESLGWLANTYPWPYDIWAKVHPVPSLWTFNQRQTSEQIRRQNQQLYDYGSGADVITINPTVFMAQDIAHWRNTYLDNGGRPFFILTDGSQPDATKSYELDVASFRDTIDKLFRQVILPYQSRYITVNGRAVIYLWCTACYTGLAKAVESVKDYPIFFLGGDPGGSLSDTEDVERIGALDGIMHYGWARDSYVQGAETFSFVSFKIRQFLRAMEAKNGKKYLLIPVFQAALDDKHFPGRTGKPMYARSRSEVEYHAEQIKRLMDSGVFDRRGPFVVQSELVEGAAVIESQCLPDTIDRPGRWVGCGTARLEILKQYFGK